MSSTLEQEKVADAETPVAEEHPVPVILDLRPIAISADGQPVDRDPADEHYGPRQSFLRRRFLFLFLFVLPTAIASIYFAFIASDRYVSEAKYIVRMAAAGEGGGLSSLMQSPGLSRAVDESYAINEYLTSREIIPILERDGNLKDILSRPEGDFINRWPNAYQRTNREALFKHLKSFVNIEADPSTGINTLEVSTFRPEDSMLLAKTLLEKGEEFVNHLNIRANDDAMSFALSLREEAVERVKDVARRLTDYRYQAFILDPTKEAEAAIKALGEIAQQLNILQVQLSEQIALTPNGPGIPSLREKIRSVQVEYDKLKANLVGSKSSLASKISGYEELMIEQELAVKGLASAAIGVEKARQDAKARRVYIQAVVQPGQADYPTRPWRLMWTVVVGMIAFCVFAIARTFRDTVLEHQA